MTFSLNSTKFAVGYLYGQLTIYSTNTYKQIYPKGTNKWDSHAIISAKFLSDEHLLYANGVGEVNLLTLTESFFG